MNISRPYTGNTVEASKVRKNRQFFVSKNFILPHCLGSISLPRSNKRDRNSRAVNMHETKQKKSGKEKKKKKSRIKSQKGYTIRCPEGYTIYHAMRTRPYHIPCQLGRTVYPASPPGHTMYHAMPAKLYYKPCPP